MAKTYQVMTTLCSFFPEEHSVVFTDIWCKSSNASKHIDFVGSSNSNCSVSCFNSSRGIHSTSTGVGNPFKSFMGSISFFTISFCWSLSQCCPITTLMPRSRRKQWSMAWIGSSGSSTCAVARLYAKQIEERRKQGTAVSGADSSISLKYVARAADMCISACASRLARFCGESTTVLCSAARARIPWRRNGFWKAISTMASRQIHLSSSRIGLWNNITLLVQW